MIRDPYETIVLESDQDFQFFAGVVIARLVKTAKPATRQTCLQHIFNQLKDSVSYEQLTELERNFKNLFNAKKKKQQ